MKTGKALVMDVRVKTNLGDHLQALLNGRTELSVCRHVLSGRDTADSATEASSAVNRCNPDVCLLVMPGDRDREITALFRAIQRCSGSPPTIAVLNDGSPAEITDLLALGAADFLLAPLEQSQVIPRIERFLNHPQSQELSVKELKSRLGLNGFVGESSALMSEIKKVPAIAACNASVLVVGESGSGKELCARAIHYLSARAARPFIAVNCGAIPAELVENELFGHESGAYTGATASTEGIIQEAEGGTLFLDEIDTLPALSQVKLLRFLQEREYRRVGSRKLCKANIRVVAATNCNFKEALASGKFRQDLYYRLNTVTLTMPSLRDRSDDIPRLANHFLKKFSLEFERASAEFSPGAMQKLLGYDWPGNVRELENIIARSVLLAEHNPITATEILLPEHVGSATGSLRELKALMIAQFERRYISQLLAVYQGNISRAARAANKHRRAFWELMRKHQIRVKENGDAAVILSN